MKQTAMNRRQAITVALAGAGALGAGLPAFAHENPMPEGLRQALERQPDTPVLGNPDGDVTLVEFFDYNCPHCRTSVPDIARLIESDPGLRVVLREWPIFGDDSVAATKVSLAALQQGNYWAFHSNLMAISGKADEQAALRVAEDIGLDIARLRADMESPAVLNHIGHSMQLGNDMALMGTPSFIAGHEALFGRQTTQTLAGLVAKARHDLG
ncbi:MAG: DsbA family protein [Paracoccaceae bacterium]